MRLGSYPLTRIAPSFNRLANGAPPYTVEEAEKEREDLNLIVVNDLTLTRLCMRPGSKSIRRSTNPATSSRRRSTGVRPRSGRSRGNIVTREINRILKRSTSTTSACARSSAMLSCTASGRARGKTRQHWCPIPLDVVRRAHAQGHTLTSATCLSSPSGAATTVNELRAADAVRREAPGVNPGWNMRSSTGRWRGPTRRRASSIPRRATPSTGRPPR